MRFPLWAFAILCAYCANAATNPAWNKPVEPYRIAGNLYYVGTNYLASYLVVTPQGNILINAGFEETPALIRKSVEKLGFRFADTKYLLNSQAHDDHAAGSFWIREWTGAQVLVMEQDAYAVEHGGKGDFRYDAETRWRPCKVDRVLHDGDTVSLGGSTLVTHLTPGHTKGCTTWTMDVHDGKRTLHAVIVGGVSVNSGYILVNNPKYPGIADDYRRTFRVLRALSCDLFLGAHPGYYNGDAKYERMKAGATENPFIDPLGYREFVDDAEKEFEEKLAASSPAH